MPGRLATQSFGKMSFELLDTIMAVNIKGPLVVSQAFYPNVKASTLKKIVAISSSNGTITGEANPRPGAMFYRMSKAALNREMQIVAASVKSGRRDGGDVQPRPDTDRASGVSARQSDDDRDLVHGREHDPHDRQNDDRGNRAFLAL